MSDADQPKPIKIFNARTEWLRGEGQACDVVLSSRVRLARNLAGLPFVARASRTDRRHTLDLCRARLVGAGLAKQLMWLNLHDSPPIDRAVLAERHLISKQLARGVLPGRDAAPDEPRGVAISIPDERLSVMVNEEDHLRLQTIRTGLDLRGCFEQIDAADDSIEAGLDYAFHPRFGYLTACPTNVGTGARFSVMLHLPALRMTGEIDKVKNAAEDMSLAIRGSHGEGSQNTGDIFQLSNQTTLGKSEEALLAEMQDEIVPRVVEYERRARKMLMDRRRTILEDKVHRALGVLRGARLMTVDEAMTLLSQVRLGVVLGLVEDLPQQTVNHLLLLVQPAHLQRVSGKEMPQGARRIARAELIRRTLSPGEDISARPQA